MPRTHRKRGSWRTSAITHRLARRGDPAGHALAERHPCATDLVAVESVRCGQGQLGAVAVEQVERGDVGVQRIARLVDDRLEQLVPRPGGRRELGHAMEEPQLVELGLRRRPVARRAALGPDGRCHGRHDTSLRHESVETGLRSGCVRLRGRCPEHGPRRVDARIPGRQHETRTEEGRSGSQAYGLPVNVRMGSVRFRVDMVPVAGPPGPDQNQRRPASRLKASATTGARTAP